MYRTLTGSAGMQARPACMRDTQQCGKTVKVQHEMQVMISRSSKYLYHEAFNIPMKQSAIIVTACAKR